MKKTSMRILAMFLVLLLLLPSAFACGKKDEGDDNAESTTVSTDNGGNGDSSGEDLYDENGYLKDNLPDLDYGGYEFTALAWQGMAYDIMGMPDFWVETDNGETINDAIYWRNEEIERRLNVQFTTITVPGNFTYMSQFVQTVSDASKSGTCEYDLIGSYSMVGASLIVQGLIEELTYSEYLDYDMPWWSQSYLKSSSINGVVYTLASEASCDYIFSMHGLAINLDMLAELAAVDPAKYGTDPRQMVFDNTWTFQKFFEMTDGVGADMDMEEGKSVGDRYGFVMWNDTYCENFWTAAGISVAVEDGDGILQVSDDFAGEKTETLLSEITRRFHQTLDWQLEGTPIPDGSYFSWHTLLEGNALIGAINMGRTKLISANEVCRFGVCAYPKWDSAQEQYNTPMAFCYTVFSVPESAPDTDMSEAFLECMTSEAYRSSSPTIFETVIKGRYSVDPIDMKMYDFLKANVTVDITRIYHNNFQSSYSPSFLFRSACRAGGSGGTGWASSMQGSARDSMNEILISLDQSFAAVD